MLVVLGVDPGIRNTGWCILVDGKAKEHGVIRTQRQSWVECIAIILRGLTKIIVDWNPDFAAVEHVAWYGRSRKITLPLSHIAGAITGSLLVNGIPTYCLIPSMKAKKKWPVKWSAHEVDAANLALVAEQQESARSAGENSFLQRHLAVDKRKLSVVANVDGTG
mgnify:CR=1 FL=1